MRQYIFSLILVAALVLTANAQVMLDDVLMDRFNLALRNGRLQLDKLRAMDLPQSCANKDCLTVTYKKDGQRLASFTGMPLPPKRNVSWLMNYFRADDDASSDFTFTEPGVYELEFSVEGQVFDNFLFSISKHKAKDGQVWTVADGVWDELGFITHDPKNRTPLKFSYWMRDFLEGTGERSWEYGKYSAKIVRVQDNKTLALSNESGDETKPPLRYWKKYELMFTQAGTNGERFQAETLLARDGDYFVEFIFEGQVHGRYPFSVKSGAFEGLREHKGQKLGTDGTVFWCPRQK